MKSRYNIIILTMFLFLTACTSSPDEKKSIDSAFKTTSVKNGDLTQTIKVEGSWNTDRLVVLRAEESGIAVRVKATPGTRVKKGEVLAVIKNDRFRKQFELSSITYHLDYKEFQAATKKLEAERLLYLTDQSTKQDYINASIAFKRAEVAIKKKEWDFNDARERLKNLVVKAPFSGIIMSSKTREGFRVSAGQELFKFADDRSILIRLNIPEIYMGMIRTGQTVSVGSRIKTTLAYFEPKEDREEKIVTAVCFIEKLPSHLNIGSAARAEILISTKKNIPILPVECVWLQKGKYVVFRKTKQKIEALPVSVGIIGKHSIEITSDTKDLKDIILIKNIAQFESIISQLEEK